MRGRFRGCRSWMVRLVSCRLLGHERKVTNPWSSFRSVSSLDDKYSTVGSRVPICRRSSPLNSWPASFLTCPMSMTVQPTKSTAQHNPGVTSNSMLARLLTSGGSRSWA